MLILALSPMCIWPNRCSGENLYHDNRGGDTIIAEAKVHVLISLIDQQQRHKYTLSSII